MILRLRICSDLLFYDDYRPGFSSAFVVVSGGYAGFGRYGLCAGLGGCVGFRGAWGRVVLVASFVVWCGWFFFVLVEGAILYPYFCGIVYALCWFALMFLINLVLLCMVILCL